jgi:hypothetical protein
VESFNSRARDELFDTEEFATLLEAQVVVEALADRGQHIATALSLGDQTPAECAASWTAKTNQHPHRCWTTSRVPPAGQLAAIHILGARAVAGCKLLFFGSAHTCVP